MPVRFAPPTEKADMVASPGVLLVTVTELPLALAVKPTGKVVWQLALLIAAATFEAKVVALESVAKCPTVELVHAFVPLEPAVTAPHEKVVSPPATEKVVNVPGVVSVAVTVLVVALAVAPTAGKAVLQALIASLRFVARVVVLPLVTKVPVKVGVEPMHVAVPALPPLTEPH